MGERKVLNKYYPPDFDPAKIPKRKRPKNEQIKIRMMLPMSIRCNTCGTYIYKGTKFNSRKEDVVGETYLGIQIFRFYFKCTKCSAELTMKTDPQNSDYVVESGAARNFEPWRKEDETTEKLKMKRMEEEMGDAMKTLENKALDSKTDMDILNALEEMKSMKTRHETVSFELMLAALNRPSNEKEKQMIEEVDEADEALIKSIVFHNSKDFVRRIQDDEDEDIYDDVCQPPSKSIKHNFKEKSIVGNPTDSLTTASIFNTCRNADGGSSARKPRIIVKPKIIVKPQNGADSSEKPQTVQESQSAQGSSQSAQEDSSQCAPEGSQSAQKEQAKGSESIDVLQSLCANYDEDSDE